MAVFLIVVTNVHRHIIYCNFAAQAGLLARALICAWRSFNTACIDDKLLFLMCVVYFVVVCIYAVLHVSCSL